ncbi:MAG: ABC transporter substrate-binding protein [Bifidobacteriaceae bacterium]|nr:ABC transporter substrate-binding protein [Bifidobacteriaceae bacterium]
MKTFRTTALITASCLLAATLAACGANSGDDASPTGAATGAPSADTAITVGIATVDHLTPGNQETAYDVLLPLFAPLVTVDQNGNTSLVQAESIESPDGLTWTVKLRDGWTFHNGEKVTADTYINAWNHAAYGPNAWINNFELAPIAGYAEMQGEAPAAETLSGLKKVDETTFTIELTAADRQFPLQLSDAQTAFYPMPAAAFEDLEAYDVNPIGNGPFQMAAAWDPASQGDIVLEAYPGYAGDKPAISQINYKIYLDIATAYTDALAGTLDVANVAGSKTAVAKEDFGDRFKPLDAPSVDWLGFNPDDPRFDDIRVRQAFSMAIDRSAVNDAIFSGSQVPATSLTSPNMPGNPDGICGQYCEFHPDEAKELLAAAGGVEGAVEILFVGGWGQEDMFEAFAAQLSQNLGIEAVATPSTDFADFQARRDAGQYALLRGHWGALYASQQNTLRAAFTADGLGYDATHYSNPEVDALINAADSAPTLEAAAEGYVKVQERILADFPTIPTFANRFLWVTSERIDSMPSTQGSPFYAQITLK